MISCKTGKLPDVPWHIGYPKKAEDDPRRHKSRCIYYKNGQCTSICTAYCNTHCPGSSHCTVYKEATPEFKESLKGEINRKETRIILLGSMNSCKKDKAMLDKPHTSLICGDVVQSKAYGKGTVVEIDNDYCHIKVSFDGTVKIFTYESAKSYLTKINEQNNKYN